MITEENRPHQRKREAPRAHAQHEPFPRLPVDQYCEHDEQSEHAETPQPDRLRHARTIHCARDRHSLHVVRLLAPPYHRFNLRTWNRGDTAQPAATQVRAYRGTRDCAGPWRATRFRRRHASTCGSTGMNPCTAAWHLNCMYTVHSTGPSPERSVSSPSAYLPVRINVVARDGASMRPGASGGDGECSN